ERLGEVLVEPEGTRERTGDLRHLEAMGEARAVVIALVIDEYLGFVVQPAEGGTMQDAIPVAPERRAGRARRLVIKPPAALERIGGIRGKPGLPPPVLPASVD